MYYEIHVFLIKKMKLTGFFLLYILFFLFSCEDNELYMENESMVVNMEISVECLNEGSMEPIHEKLLFLGWLSKSDIRVEKIDPADISCFKVEKYSDCDGFIHYTINQSIKEGDWFYVTLGDRFNPKVKEIYYSWEELNKARKNVLDNGMTIMWLDLLHLTLKFEDHSLPLD